MSRHKILGGFWGLLGSGCFSPTVPVSDDAMSAESTSTSTAGGNSSAAATGEGASSNGTASDASSGGTSSQPQIAVVVTLDGVDDPAALTTQGVHELVAEVIGGKVSLVEFFDGEQPLGSDSEAPYRLDLPITSIDSGFKVLRAVARVDGSVVGEAALEVSINVAGGNVDAIERNVLSTSLRPAGISGVGGGIAVHEGRVYIAAISADGTGELLSLLPELEEQWRRSFTNGLLSAPAGLDVGRVGVANLQGGNWVVQVVSTDDGDTVASWILGAEPGGFADFGPLLAPASGGVLASTAISTLEAFSIEGAPIDSSAVDLSYGVITSLVAGGPDDLVFAAFGDAFESEDSSCATTSDFCAAAVTASGTLEWVTGLTEEAASVHRLAAASGGGVFAAASGLESEDGSYMLLRIGPNGVVENSRRHGYVAGTNDDGNDNVWSISSPPTTGGAVVCGAHGPVVEDGGVVSSPFVAYYDEGLDTVWETRDFVSNRLGAFILGCAASSTHVFIFGVEGQSVEDVNGAPAAVGDGWVARIGL